MSLEGGISVQNDVSTRVVRVGMLRNCEGEVSNMTQMIIKWLLQLHNPSERVQYYTYMPAQGYQRFQDDWYIDHQHLLNY